MAYTVQSIQCFPPVEEFRLVEHLFPSTFSFSSIYKVFVLGLPFTLGWEDSHLSNDCDPTWPDIIFGRSDVF